MANKPEFNYYPQTIASSTKMGTAEEPQANAPNVANPEQINESGGSTKVTGNSIQSGNYIKNIAGWMLDAAGNLFALSATIVGTITATAGAIGGWVIAATTLSSDSDNIVLDSANEKITVGGIEIDGVQDRIRSDNYVAGIAGVGFTLEPELLEVGNARIRGTIRTAVFQKDVISSVGGSFAVIDSDVLAVDMTALDASTLTIDGDTTFAVGDFLRIKDGTDDEWLEVTNIGSAPTYTVTRDKDGDYAADTNPAWKMGATVVNYKQSGDGLIYMTASDTNAPYLEVQTHAGSPWSALTPRLRLGNLNGFLDYSSDLYGIGIGESTQYLKYDPTNGLRIAGQLEVSTFKTAGEDITAGEALIIGDGSTYETTQTTEDSGGSITNSTWVGQTFNIKGVEIVNVKLSMRNNQPSDKTATVSIRATSSGLPTGADLGSVDLVIATGAAYLERTFTFATPIEVTPNATYALMVRNSDGSVINYKYNSSSVYSGGTRVDSTDTGSSWSAVAAEDLYFKITETTSTAGSIYLADASNGISPIFYTNFIGSAAATVSASAEVPIVISGSSVYQTGLSIGSIYYLSNTPGAIASSAGDNSKKVGISLSATELLILNS